MSGLTPRYPLAPPVCRSNAALDLVEGEQRAVIVHYLAHTLQVALLRRNDASVHHYRLEDHARYPSAMLFEKSLQGVEVVVRDDQGEVGDGPRDARPGRRAVGTLGGPDLIFPVRHGDHDRIMMPMVTTLYLDDEIPARDRAHQVHRIHRRLGARVGETPQRKTETPRELVSHDDSILRGLGEMRAPRNPQRQGLDYLRMAVANGADAVPAVEIHILPTVCVVDLRALPVADPDHLRTGDLPTRGRPSCQNPPRLPDQSPRPGLAFLESAFTLDNDLVEPAEVPVGPTPHSLHILLL
jgi:hypothetical protein